jgi:hypothetical protein
MVTGGDGVRGGSATGEVEMGRMAAVAVFALD